MGSEMCIRDGKMAEHYGAIFIPKGEVNLIESIIAVANDNCKSDK